MVALDPCGTPTAVRAACLAKVLGVRGTRSLVHPRLRRPASPNRLGGRRAPGSPAATQLAVTAAGGPQPGTPAYLQQVYDLAYLSQTAGGGATIAIVDAFDAPNAEADLATYRAEFALPACTTANGCFRKVDQTGGNELPREHERRLGARGLPRSRCRVGAVPQMPHRARRGGQRQSFRTSPPPRRRRHSLGQA